MSRLDTLRRDLWHDDIRPSWPAPPGAPMCSEERCPSYDGKRCERLGSRPSSICEPAVDRAVETLAGVAE